MKLKYSICLILVFSIRLALGDAREAALLESSVSQIRAGKAATAISTLRTLSKSSDAAVARPAAFWLSLGALEQKTLVRAGEAETMLRDLAGGSMHDQWQERAVILLAQRSREAGEQDKALRSLDHLLSGNRNSPWMILAAELTGDIRVETEDKPTAIKAYTYALQIAGYLKGYEKQDIPPELDLNRIRRKLAALQAKSPKQYKENEPADTFKNAERDRNSCKYDLAIQQYDQIISEYPDHILAAASGYRTGWCLVAQKNDKGAEAYWRKFVEANPVGPWRAQSMIGLGDLILERDLDAEKAEVLFKAVVDGRGNGETWLEARPDALERYGICLFMKRDFEGAEKCFAEELSLRPKRKLQGLEIPSQMQFLKEMCSKKKYPVKYPEKVMIGSRQVQTALFLAAAYGECGSHDRANKFLDIVTDGKLPGTLPVHKAYACYDKADNMKLQGKADEAEKLFKTCVNQYRTTPIAPLAQLELANLYFAKARNAEGEAALKEVWTKFASSPEAGKARYNYGWSKYFAKDWPGALAVFQELVTKHPGTWEANKAKEVIIPDIGKKMEQSK